jgi:hypothetical protein
LSKNIIEGDEQMSVKKEISVDIGDKTYTAPYTHEDGVVTVTSGFSKKSTHAVTPKEAESTARLLLREIVEAGEYNSQV